MSHNFQCLEQEAPLLFNIAQVAEKIIYIAPVASIIPKQQPAYCYFETFKGWLSDRQSVVKLAQD